MSFYQFYFPKKNNTKIKKKVQNNKRKESNKEKDVKKDL